MKIGKKIRDLRKERKLTQKELGILLGYTESFISYIESGERNVSLEDIKNIALIFKVDVSYFTKFDYLSEEERLIKIEEKLDKIINFLQIR